MSPPEYPDRSLASDFDVFYRGKFLHSFHLLWEAGIIFSNALAVAGLGIELE